MDSHHFLFGDNMSVRLPNDISDVSKLREIPDNQEVFTHTKTDQSIIIEILEYVQEADEQAIRTHLDDISKSNDATEASIKFVESVPLEKLDMSQCRAAYFLSSQQMVSKFNENAKNQVNIHLGLFRLPQFETDILLSFNDPEAISPQSSSHGPVPEICQPWTLDNFREILCSLKINNADFLG